MASEAWVCHHVTKVRETRQCQSRKRFNDREQEIQLSRADEHWRFQTESTLMLNLRKALMLNIWHPISNCLQATDSGSYIIA
jgi:hypothetical protein